VRQFRLGKLQRERNASSSKEVVEKKTHMTVDPFLTASMEASRRALDPPAKAGNSKTPAGPFQRMVLDSATVAAKSFRDSGPASRPIHPSGIPVASVATPVWSNHREREECG